MKKLILCVVAIASAHASEIVSIAYQDSPTTPDGFYHFLVDGWAPIDLICDDATHQIGSGYYQAAALSLTDNLDLTLAARDGDPDPLAKYTLIALLDMRAYIDTSLGVDVQATVRHIIDPLAEPSFNQTLLDWATAQNPADYNLTGFRTFAPLTDGLHVPQEQTGFFHPPIDKSQVPEPASMVMMGAGLLACGLFRRLTRKRPM